ncbi:hypothetical protein KIPB_011154, partial [Kipferlia bialata]
PTVQWLEPVVLQPASHRSTLVRALVSLVGV